MVTVWLSYLYHQIFKFPSFIPIKRTAQYCYSESLCHTTAYKNPIQKFLTVHPSSSHVTPLSSFQLPVEFFNSTCTLCLGWFETLPPAYLSTSHSCVFPGGVSSGALCSGHFPVMPLTMSKLSPYCHFHIGSSYTRNVCSIQLLASPFILPYRDHLSSSVLQKTT